VLVGMVIVGSGFLLVFSHGWSKAINGRSKDQGSFEAVGCARWW
jgi:hypothetical protein